MPVARLLPGWQSSVRLIRFQFICWQLKNTNEENSTMPYNEPTTTAGMK